MSEVAPKLNNPGNLLSADDEARVIQEGAGKDKLLRLAIDEAPDFRALFTILHENSGIRGSQKHYSYEEITQLIGKVQQGVTSSDFLTSAYGLRAKVEYLIEKSR